MIDVLALLLIALAVLDWTASIVLVRGALHLKAPALEERATAAVILTLGATGGAILSAAYLLGVDLPDGFSLLFLSMGFLALSIPQLVWTLGYWLGRFR